LAVAAAATLALVFEVAGPLAKVAWALLIVFGLAVLAALGTALMLWLYERRGS
jgi:hypothetical protein